MSIVIGIWFAVAGGLAVLAGLTGMRRVRRLHRDGVATWAALEEPPAGLIFVLIGTWMAIVSIA